MSSITLDVPDGVADKLRALADRLPRILDLGLRALSAEGSSEYEGVADVLEFLATLPPAEEVLSLRAAPTLQEPAEKFRDLTMLMGVARGLDSSTDADKDVEQVRRRWNLLAERHGV